MRLRKAVLTVAAACLALTACRPTYDEDFQAFDAQAQAQVERPDSSSVIDAFMAGHYRALGFTDLSDDAKHGYISLAKCDLSKVTLQACQTATPTPDDPHAYVPFSRYLDSHEVWQTMTGNTETHWQMKVGDTTLDCTSELFQLNAYSITQVPQALKMFIVDGKPVTGDKETDLQPNPDPNGPYTMGKVRWKCGALES